jgi:hypothetical protein
MPSSRTTPATDREQHPKSGTTVQKKGRGKKTTNNKKTAGSVPSQDMIVANTRTDADVNTEIAELKGDSHAQMYVDGQPIFSDVYYYYYYSPAS